MIKVERKSCFCEVEELQTIIFRPYKMILKIILLDFLKLLKNMPKVIINPWNPKIQLLLFILLYDPLLIQDINLINISDIIIINVKSILQWSRSTDNTGCILPT